MSERCDENALSQTKVVCGQKKIDVYFNTETAAEQRPEFASNPGWNNLIATM